MGTAPDVFEWSLSRFVLVDMIVLDMFRTHVGWRKSFKIFSDHVSSEPSRKIAQNGKNCLVKPKKA